MKHFLIAFRAQGSKTIFASIDAANEEAAKKYFSDNYSECSILGITELNI